MCMAPNLTLQLRPLMAVPTAESPVRFHGMLESTSDNAFDSGFLHCACGIFQETP